MNLFKQIFDIDSRITAALAFVNIWVSLSHLDVALKVVIGALTVVILVPKAWRAIRGKKQDKEDQ